MNSQLKCWPALPILLCSSLQTNALPDRRPSSPDLAETVSYCFTARIKSNGGVTPFKVGEVLMGKFTYDVNSRAVRSNQSYAHMESTRNSIEFRHGSLLFYGTGDVLATVSSFNHSEHFGVVAPDLSLPPGWDMSHQRMSQSYSVLFQNAPNRGIIKEIKPPGKINLADYVSVREVRLDFFEGVRFPGGQVVHRATVMADIVSLDMLARP